MIELHCHSLLSDGELTPSELVMLARSLGYKGIVITDHVDQVNIYHVCGALREGIKKLSRHSPIPVFWGAEITHVPPRSILDMVKELRSLGASLVVGHGETIVEPVMEGTNEAFVEAGVDILAHPGLISEEVAKEAASKGIYLEITTRKGHAYTNGHVLKIGKAVGASFVICNDTHTYGDMVNRVMAGKILMGAGATEKDISSILRSNEELFGCVSQKG